MTNKKLFLSSITLNSIDGVCTADVPNQNGDRKTYTTSFTDKKELSLNPTEHDGRCAKLSVDTYIRGDSDDKDDTFRCVYSR